MILAGLTTAAHALPPGKSWSARQPYRIPPGANAFPERFVVEQDGSLLLLTTTASLFDGGELLRWQDSTWAVSQALPYRPSLIWPALSTTVDRHVVWQTQPPRGSEAPAYLVIAGIRGGNVFELDTVATANPGNDAYSAAVTSSRRWAAVDYAGRLDVFLKTPGQLWRQIATDVAAYNRISVAPLTDSTALIVWSSAFSRMFYGVVDAGGNWVSQPFPHFEYARDPRLRRDPTGGWMLSWSTIGPEIRHSYYEDGTWSQPVTVGCEYPDGPDSVHTTNTLDLSYDDALLPAMAWTADSYQTGQRSLCVAIPVGSEPLVGEFVPGGTNTWIPTIARDRYGDVWIAWAYDTPFGFDGLYWQHTFTSVTSSAPVATRRGRGIELRWVTTGPAPGARWSVQRATGSEFHTVGMVTGDRDQIAFTWTDTNPPSGHVRYRLLRECLDVRYRWLSEEGRWPQKSRRPSLLVVTMDASGSTLQVLDAAPGAVLVQIFDIQGRAVRESRAMADSLPITVTFTHEGLGAGVYFIRATDRLGDQSVARKIAILR